MASALVGVPTAPSDDAALASVSGGGQKWCSGCPHAKRDGSPLACFNSPSYLVRRASVPPSVWVDKERVRAIERAKEVNAQKFGMTNVPLVKPTQADIHKYLKSRKEKKDRAKKKATKGGSRCRVSSPRSPAAWRPSAARVVAPPVLGRHRRCRRSGAA